VADKEGNCERCRANNEGVCRIIYYKYDFILNSKYSNILKMKAPEEGKFKIDYDYDNLDVMGNFQYIRVDGIKFPYRNTGYAGICFGFLKLDSDK